ncbi:6-carboxytetrahydropterin synthase QueD [Candidatus Peregrinibacteria bacterium CG10_big_fil_rev_8_21_14_0_10_36_19]|nr:MAG: 6-carboxytetrahydropterin synthase QueD [Candidatus Peregrinibacteria bacterium CG10_big_fil_rev_8_21_14_0_10_36_19]
MQLSCAFRFAASHFLTKYHGKCENLHGHNYKIIITIEGPVKEDGMVLDFKIVKEVVKEKVINILDHTHLNDTIENPSAENLSVWIWEKLKNDLPLKKVGVYETEDYYCEYEG